MRVAMMKACYDLEQKKPVKDNITIPADINKLNDMLQLQLEKKQREFKATGTGTYNKVKTLYKTYEPYCQITLPPVFSLSQDKIKAAENIEKILINDGDMKFITRPLM